MIRWSHYFPFAFGPRCGRLKSGPAFMAIVGQFAWPPLGVKADIALPAFLGVGNRALVAN